MLIPSRTLPRRRPGAAGRRLQRGLSLVEMMVGVTIGLFVVAGASVLMVSQLGENRRLLLETQVQQDLRAAADLVTRDLRRAGYDRNADLHLWLPDRPQQPPTENLLAVVGTAPLTYRYTRGSESVYQISLADGVLRRRIGSGTPQPLTDERALRITAFDIAEVGAPAQKLPCPNLCPDGSEDCWPTVDVRDYTIRLRGQAVGDPAVVREIVSRVRVRNDAIAFNAAGQVCP